LILDAANLNQLVTVKSNLHKGLIPVALLLESLLNSLGREVSCDWGRDDGSDGHDNNQSNEKVKKVGCVLLEFHGFMAVVVSDRLTTPL